MTNIEAQKEILRLETIIAQIDRLFWNTSLMPDERDPKIAKILLDYAEATDWTGCCDSCGEPDEGMPVDITLPNHQWSAIKGDDELLCANCIVKRASKLPGIIAVRAVFDIWCEKEQK